MARRTTSEHRMRLKEALATGPARSSALCRVLEISQPTFSRLVHSMRRELLVVGRSRSTRYALPRTVAEVPTPIPVYEILPLGGAPRHLLHLHPVAPSGFYVEYIEDGTGEFFEDLPWFLEDLRPSGYLGRLVPRRHPDLGVPADIRVWTREALREGLIRNYCDCRRSPPLAEDKVE